MRLLTIFILFFCTFTSFAESANFSSQLVNNRILAKINGKAITVCDLLKKMDMLYFKENKDRIDSTALRIEFYETHWRHVLSDLIDRELIIADAEEKGLKVNQGDVREEVEEMFGPNILENLDKVGISFEDALKMVESDILIRRMLYLSVNSKALVQLTPQEVKTTYNQYIQEEIDHQQFTFRIISIRAETEEVAKKAATQAYTLLALKDTSEEKLKEMLDKKDGVTVSVSVPYSQERKDMSNEVYSLLSNIVPGSTSSPKMVNDQAGNFRLLQLIDKSELSTPPFSEVEDQLKDLVIRKNQMKETKSYFANLRKYFNIKEETIANDLPSQFLSFIVR